MPHSPARPAATTADRSAGQRLRTYIAIAGVLVAAALAFAFLPSPLHHGYTGPLLSVLAVLVGVTLMSMPTPATDGRFGPQWSVDGMRTVPPRRVADAVAAVDQPAYDVIVAPSAVLVAEKKYYTGSASAMDVSEQRCRDLDAADKAAQRFRVFLRSADEQDDTAVVPVLIVSGPGAPRLPAGHCIDNGVHVVDGMHPELWMHLFNKPRLRAGMRQELFGRFDQIAELR